jgi:hypothetical protein
MSESLTQWGGHWGWVYRSGFERHEIGEVAGRREDIGVGLPPGFVSYSDRVGIWGRINEETGSLIDIFEDDEISDPYMLIVAARIIDDAFASTEHYEIGSELSRFLQFAAVEGFTVEFWL